MTTIKDLIDREREQLAPKLARRTALNEALSQLGRLAKAGGVEYVDRAITVRSDLAATDADIARIENKIRELEAEQAEDDRVDALAQQNVIVPEPDSPEYPAYRQRLRNMPGANQF